MKTVTIIAAADDSWGIGLRGGLPWSLPADLARFRRRTMGCAVIVGTRTAQSLGAGLPGRRLVTVSRSGQGDHPSVADAVAAETGKDEVFVAGGAGVFREALGLAGRAEITRVDGDWGCDAFMPDLDAEGWLPIHEVQLEERARMRIYVPPVNAGGLER